MHLSALKWQLRRWGERAVLFNDSGWERHTFHSHMPYTLRTTPHTTKSTT